MGRADALKPDRHKGGHPLVISQMKISVESQRAASAKSLSCALSTRPSAIRPVSKILISARDAREDTDFGSLVYMLDANGNRTRAVEDRNIARHLAEDDDARLRDAATAVIDNKMVGTPKPKRSCCEILLPDDLWQRRW